MINNVTSQSLVGQRLTTSDWTGHVTNSANCYDEKVVEQSLTDHVVIDNAVDEETVNA